MKDDNYPPGYHSFESDNDWQGEDVEPIDEDDDSHFDTTIEDEDERPDPFADFGREDEYIPEERLEDY